MIAERRRDGVIAIGRPRRWLLLRHGIAVGLLVLLPLAVSLALVLPPLAFAAPPLTLGLVGWILLRSLGVSDVSPGEATDPSPDVIPLRGASRSSLARRGIRDHV